MSGLVHVHPVIPAQRAPRPPQSVLNGTVNAGIDSTSGAVKALSFKRPRTGTAWQLQGVSVTFGGGGSTGGGGNYTVDLVLRKNGLLIATVDNFTFAGGSVTNEWDSAASKQLIQPVPVFDTDDLALELVLGGAATGAFYVVQRGTLQIAYL